MQTRVFLSGPMSGLENFNMNAFTAAHARLKKAGAEEVFDPILTWLNEPERTSRKRDHESYMLECLAELTRSDGGRPYYDILAQLDGWQDSPGAAVEAAVAKSLGIPTTNVSGACQLIVERANASDESERSRMPSVRPQFTKTGRPLY